MEKWFKSSWRNGFNGAQKKAFSRWKRVTKLMSEEKGALGPVSLNELDQEFKLLSGFEKTLMQQKIERTATVVEQAALEEPSEEPSKEEPSKEPSEELQFPQICWFV